ncbi:MAG: ABC transporter permease [Actinobacteria bacterium]|nr:ABC transporter permease [Actinomycetota bacterium]
MVEAATTETSGGVSRASWARLDRVWLAVPAVVLTAVFFVIPILFMGRISLSVHESGSAYREGTWTLDSYVTLLTDSFYLRIFSYTLGVSLLVTVLGLALAYPIAYWINRSGPRLKVILLFAVIVPLWTNILVLIYGWLIILSPGGALNDGLMRLGLIDAPLRVVYNTFGIVVGIVQITLPYAILIIAAVLAGIDRSLVESARDMGASRLKAFLHVTLPLSTPGIASAATVIFVWSMGEYASPQLLGGSAGKFVSQEVSSQFLTAFNWPRGAGLAVTLFSLIVLILVVAQTAARVTARRSAA